MVLDQSEDEPYVVISDSEEEERRSPRSLYKGRKVVEISSDEEEIEYTSHRHNPFVPYLTPKDGNPNTRVVDKPEPSGSRSAVPMQLGNSVASESTTRVASDEVIDLSVSSDEDEMEPTLHKDKTRQPMSWEVDDRSILTCDIPKSAKKPLRIPPKPQSPSNDEGSTSKDRTLLKRLFKQTEFSDNEVVHEVKSLPATPTRSCKPRTPASSSSKPPRITKKAAKAAEQARREAYAQQFFQELNQSVFDNGLPRETKLIWNNRLITTAGKAHWHRSRDGVHTTSIQLATKVLDEDGMATGNEKEIPLTGVISLERIRNTLSHEMCHLACWIISGQPQENHGHIFKTWAAKVMKARSDIEVTTKHDYEIKYPYEWECQECSKIYGRFSRSIRPDECVCGACKTGKLKPLFEVKTRAPKTPKTSRMAATTPRDSPHPTTPVVERSIDLTVDVSVVGTPTRSKSGKGGIADANDSEMAEILRRVEGVKIDD